MAEQGSENADDKGQGPLGVGNSTEDKDQDKAKSQQADGKAQGDAGKGTDNDAFDKERAMATIKKLRDFEANAKPMLKELEDLRKLQKAADDAKLSEGERIQRQIKELQDAIATSKQDYDGKLSEAEAKRLELEAELAETRRATRVAKVAADLGAHDPQDANILAAASGIDVTKDKADETIKAKLEELKKAKPYLFRTGARLENFNPGNPDGRAEGDQARFNRLQRTSQGGVITPFS